MTAGEQLCKECNIKASHKAEHALKSEILFTYFRRLYANMTNQKQYILSFFCLCFKGLFQIQIQITFIVTVLLSQYFTQILAKKLLTFSLAKM